MEANSVAIGQEVPDFCLPNQNGEQVCLTDF